jgi:L-threonylcarbamoyladenylate synthase
MMRIVKATKEGARKAAAELAAGNVVIYPTDTVYGLAADATNKKAVSKVFGAKGRGKQKPVSIMFSNLAMAKKYLTISIRDAIYIRMHNGPYTFIIPKKTKIALHNGNSREIGIRIASTAFTRALIRAAGFPITATSANRSGEEPSRSVAAAVAAVGRHCSLAIDGGMTRSRPSMVVDLASKKVLRR